MRWIALTAGVVVIFGIVGCEPQQEEPAPRSEAEEVATAQREFDPAMFDTVSWASDSAAIARGRDIFAWVCAECHGEGGLGDGGRVIDGDTIRPPSFLADDWGYANDPLALREKVFVGNTLGMPHWGLREMRPRDIVAVERFIRFELIQGAGETPE